jgi:alpha-galactosidase
MKIQVARIGEQLVLALPEHGMPIIVSAFAHVGFSDAGLEALLHRAPRVNGMDVAVPSAQHLPTSGHGYYRWPAVMGHRNGRDFTIHPANWKISKSSEDALEISAMDPAAKLELKLSFKLTAVLQMQTTLRNAGDTPYNLDRCMAGTVLVPGTPRAYVGYHGSWGREFHECRESASKKLWLQESRRGRTSHDRFPAVAIESGMASGPSQVYAMHVGCSGNHVIAIDPMDDGRVLMHGGELFEPGEMILQPGENYVSPIAYAGQEAYGDAFDLWPKFHAVVRDSILKWPGGEMKPRPVILNTWEGNYFNHKVDNLKAQATAAEKLGIERFVLDDGWFGKRDDDTSSLGDWTIDKRKYPDGLGPLVDHVTSLGMEFGIWFEPEMVNRNSDLYRAHPNWILQVKGQPLLEARHQMVLDLTRKDVSDYLFKCVDDVLSAYKIAYIKWDMNRDLSHVGDAEGRAATSKQTHAVYALMARIRAAHPDVEIESCASGGGRADYGVLQHTHRVWISDCTDALERLSIQQGARRFLPPEIMGCHIAASPNHQTMRRHTLSFRAIVAFFGHLGVELNPLDLSDAERKELTAWISLHKKLRSLLHHPDAILIDRPVVDGRFVFGVKHEIDEMQEEHIVLAVAQSTQTLQEQPLPLAIPVYCSEKNFTVKLLGPNPPPFVRPHPGQVAMLDGKTEFSGGLLASMGLNVPQLYPESAILLEIKTVGAKHG